MFFREVTLPAPFHRAFLFALIEPEESTEPEIRFRHRLYLADRYAEGGKVLLMDCPAYSLPKLIECEVC